MSNPRLAIIGDLKILEGYYANQSPLVSVIPGLSGLCAGLAQEVRMPAIWFYQASSKTVKELDLLTHVLTGRSVAVSTVPVSIQVDPFTGDVWMLSDALYVLRRRSSTFTAIDLVLSNQSTALTTPNDSGFDFVRRQIWVVDTGGKRLLQITTDGTVVGAYSPATFTVPTALAIDIGSGDVFVRCSNPMDSSESIQQVRNSQLVRSWSVGSMAQTPLSGSIAFDSSRQQLWWAANTQITMVNLAANSGRTLTLGSPALLVALDLGSGEAYVVGNSGGGNISVNQIDSTNRNLTNALNLTGVGNPKAIFVEQGHDDLLIGHLEVVPTTTGSADLTGSFESVVSSKAVFNSQKFLTGESVFDTAEDLDVILPKTPEVNGASVDVLIWNDGKSGVSQVSSSGLHGLPNERSRGPEVIKLPKFSWSSTSYIRQPEMLVGRESGDIELWQTPVGGDGYLGSISKSNTFIGQRQPTGSMSISGIASRPNQQTAFASAGKWMIALDSDTLNPVSVKEMPYLAVATDAESAWLAAGRDGKVIRVNGDTVTTFDVFDAPLKVVWSSYHQKAIVMGAHSVFSLDQNTGKSEIISASKFNRFNDIDVAPNGELLLVIGSAARLFNPTFSKIINEVNTPQWLLFGRITRPGQFVVCGTQLSPAGSSSSSSSSSQTIFISSNSSSSLSSQSGYVSQPLWFILATGIHAVTTSAECLGDLAGLTYEENQLFAVAVTTGGDVVEVPVSEQERSLRIVKNIGGGVTCASNGPHSVSVSSVSQSQVRVFVGSQPWQSDRWDSGVITTDKSAILYGGGDNLEPGQPYWVHISTYHDDSGWAVPSILRFLVPSQL